MKYGNNVMLKNKEIGYKRILIGFITSGLILFSIFIVSSIIDSGKSQAFDETNTIKYYTSIRIESGDTLWKIATHYMSPEYDSIREYIEEVKHLNHLDPDDIQAGQYLTIPYYSNEFR